MTDGRRSEAPQAAPAPEAASEKAMRPTLKKLPCKGGCGEDVLANPDVVFGPYHRECWTKFLTSWVNLQNAIEKEKR